MTRILGIDPGSRFTGYGLIDSDGQHAHYISSGCLKISGDSLSEKLGLIFNELQALIGEFQPHQFAIESVFMHRNADSALKLGQVRGAAICAAVTQDLPVAEYAPREIKQAIVGTGAARKEQVQHMIVSILKLNGAPSSDASDALTVALCHSNERRLHARLGTGNAIAGAR